MSLVDRQCPPVVDRTFTTNEVEVMLVAFGLSLPTGITALSMFNRADEFLGLKVGE